MRSLNLLAGGLAVLLSNKGLGADVCTENCVERIVTDFKWKPPFKRSKELVPVVDIMQVEMDSAAPVKKSRSKKFGGRPPFRR